MPKLLYATFATFLVLLASCSPSVGGGAPGPSTGPVGEKGIITTFVGPSAGLAGPIGIAFDKSGNLYIADSDNNRICEVSGGVITTIAGNGTAGYRSSDDGGPATSAELSWPNGIAFDKSGNLYIADTQNSRIREVSGGIITTFKALSDEPAGIAFDASGNLYFAGTGRIYEISGGIITTVAGGGTSGLGDGGPATSAELNRPEGVAFDASGNLYIADTHNNLIRKVQ